MHREVVKREGNTFLLVVALIVIIFLCMSILDYFMISNYRLIVDLVAVAVLTTIALMIIKYKIVEYQYVLIDEDIIFHRILGKKDTVVLSIKKENILVIAPITSEQLQKWTKVDKCYKLTTSFSNKNKYCGIFCKDGQYFKAIFEPSEKLLKMLEKSMPDSMMK